MSSIKTDQLCRVLLVEDDASEALIFESWLKKNKRVEYQITHKQRLDGALLWLENQTVDIIVLDLTLPDSIGTSSVQTLRTKYKNIPVVVMSGQKDENIALSTVKTGAQDYLVKDDTTPEVLHRAIFNSIERNKIEQRLSFLAKFDHLTQIPNRNSFFEAVESSLIACKSENGFGPAVIQLELDGFKNVNGMYGHEVGDKLLIEVASRIIACVGDVDTVARVGGDEFALLLQNVPDKNSVIKTIDKIKKSLSAPISDGNISLNIATRMGVSMFPDGGTTSTLLVQNADYAACELGENLLNQVRFYDAGMRIKQQRQERLKRDLSSALENEEFFILYQPIVDSSTKAVKAFEALLRWNHPTLGLVSPLEFIDVLELSGDIVEVGAWILDTSCKQLKGWMSEKSDALCLAVNVSPKQLQDKSFAKTVQNTLEKYEIPAGCLEIEITEHLLMQSTHDSMAVFKELTDLGVRFSMDDFGTGYSQLRYLIDFPIDTLKIDRSIISALDTTKGQTITKMLLAMSKELKLQVVAEGIEESYQSDFLKENNCDLMQGFYFSKPISSADAKKLVDDRNSIKKHVELLETNKTGATTTSV